MYLSTKLLSQHALHTSLSMLEHTTVYCNESFILYVNASRETRTRTELHNEVRITKRKGFCKRLG